MVHQPTGELGAARCQVPWRQREKDPYDHLTSRMFRPLHHARRPLALPTLSRRESEKVSNHAQWHRYRASNATPDAGKIFLRTALIRALIDARCDAGSATFRASGYTGPRRHFLVHSDWRLSATEIWIGGFLCSPVLLYLTNEVSTT